MQVHGNHMVHTSDGEEVCEHAGRDGTTVTLLLGLTGVGEVSRQGSASSVLLIQIEQAAYGMTAR